MKTPPIRGIIEVSLTHWAGRISSVVYVGGCTLRCGNCPSPHLVGWGEGKGTIPLDSVLDAIYQRRRWVEGVVVKGGEPLAHPEMPDLLELFKDFGLLIRVETNGTRPEALRNLIERDLVDSVALEIRAPLTDLYHEVAGTTVDLSAVFSSIETLLSGEVEYEFRTAVGDGRLSEEDVLSIARTIRGADRYVLRSAKGGGPSRARLRRLAAKAGRHVRICHVDGRPPDREPMLIANRDHEGGQGREAR
jgi:pyruvate formate lyase activating enzyme